MDTLIKDLLLLNRREESQFILSQEKHLSTNTALEWSNIKLAGNTPPHSTSISASTIFNYSFREISRMGCAGKFTNSGVPK